MRSGNAVRPGRAVAVVVALVLSACGGGNPALQGAVTPDLETFEVSAAEAVDARDWDGVVEAVARADLAAQTSGRVTRVDVDINDTVKAGDVLVRLTAVEQQAGASTARAQLRAAEATAVEAEANYRRFAALADGQYVSRAQIDQARAARDAAVAARNAAGAQLAQAEQQADYTIVRAPFDGIVSARDVEPGESVSPGQPLVSLHAPGRLRIEVQVPQTQADAIRASGRAAVVLADGRHLQAGSVVVYPAADVATHSVAVRIELPQIDDPPAPGTTARVSFPMPSPTAVAPMRIPASAVVRRGELTGAYVVEDGNVVLRQLRLGRDDGESAEVIAGLRPGDRVAVDPVAALAARVAVREAAGAAHD